MNTTTTTSRHIKNNKTASGIPARRAWSISVAGALACLALAPTIAHAAQVTAEGGSASSSRDIDDVISERKHQMASDHVELAAARPQVTMSVGHCGHHALHQPPGVAGQPVSSWYTPTSC